MPNYVYTNTLAPGPRKLVVAVLEAGVLVAVLATLAMWLRRRAAGLDAVERASRRLAPLCLAAFVPLLFHWQLWTGPRELSFVVAGVGLRAVAAGADAGRAGRAAAAAGAHARRASTPSAPTPPTRSARLPWLPRRSS